MAQKHLTVCRRARWILLWAGLIFFLQNLGGQWLCESLGLVAGRRFNDSGRHAAPAVEESIVQWQISLLNEATEPEDVLFFGDSSCLMGVMPQVITTRTGLTASNFGTLGWLSAEGHADILQLYLANRGAPKLAVYHVCTYPLVVTRAEIERVGYREALRAWLADRQGTRPLGWLLGTQLRATLRNCVATLVLGTDRELFLNQRRGPYPSDGETGQILMRTRGYLADPTPPRSDEFWSQYAASVAQQLGRPRFCGDCIPGLKRMFELADASSFDLQLVLNPLPEAYQSPETDAAFQELENAVRALAAHYRRVRVGSPLARYYPNRFFGTAVHLTETGARHHSEELAEWIVHWQQTAANGLIGKTDSDAQHCP